MRFDVNANKYFVIYKMGLETKEIKVIECCLYDIEVKYSNNLETNISLISWW